MKLLRLMSFLCFAIFLNNILYAQSSGSFGIRGGVGTDISGGLAYGGSINYQFPWGNNWGEIGPVLFFSSVEETTEEFHTYVEKTDLFVFGVLANYLVNYDPTGSGAFFVVGIGFAGISVEWEESSDTDESLGTPLPEGGSKQSEDATAGGSVLNVGAGYKFTGNVDIRVELPVIIIAGGPERASSVVPTIIATLGVHF
jgi:hypothetical protein